MDLSSLIAPFIIPRKTVIRKRTNQLLHRLILTTLCMVVVATLIRENRNDLWSMEVFSHKGKNFYFTLRYFLLYLSFCLKL